MSMLFMFLYTFAVGAIMPDPFLSCERLLGSAEARAARTEALRIYAADDEVDDEVAYVGVSSRELIDLLNTGEIEFGKTRNWPRLLKDSTSLKDYVRRNTVLEYDADAPAAQRKLAHEDAWVRTVLDLIRSRQETIDFEGDRVLDMLRSLNYGYVRGEAYSPSYIRLREAAESSKLPQVGKRLRRLRALSNMLKQTWPTEKDTEATRVALEKGLTSIFWELPPNGGVILTMKPSVIARMTWSLRAPPHLPTVRIEDISHIEPVNDEVYEFLEHLSRELVD